MNSRHYTTLPDPLVRAVRNNDPTGVAVEWARFGVPVLPCYTIESDGSCSCGNLSCASPGKHPISKFVPRGVKDATADIQTIHQVFALYPDANIGLAMGNGLVALDLDPRHGADLAEGYGADSTLTERTGSGGHHRIFGSDSASPRSRVLAPGAELKSSGSYIVSTPSRHASGRMYMWEDMSARIAGMPPSWQTPLAPERARLRLHRGTMNPAINVRAERVVRSLLHGRYAATVRQLLDGEWDSLERYPSHSEADGALITMATHFTLTPAVLDAVLRRSGLYRQKWDVVHTVKGETYGEYVIGNALEWRRARSGNRLLLLAERLGVESDDGPAVVADGASSPETSAARTTSPLVPVIYRTPLTRDQLQHACLRFIGTAPTQDVMTDGFVRLPVADMARVCDVAEKTVQRAITAAAAAELIETRVSTERYDGRVIRTRWVRAADGTLALIREQNEKEEF